MLPRGRLGGAGDARDWQGGLAADVGQVQVGVANAVRRVLSFQWHRRDMSLVAQCQGSRSGPFPPHRVACGQLPSLVLIMVQRPLGAWTQALQPGDASAGSKVDPWRPFLRRVAFEGLGEMEE